ncbi:putative UDP-N-acetylglucosamine--peptide N-acetylglucosaminyltransferase SPINDLY [Sulfurifustis variabilis]|uniref:protein O-GlcNAc transferase n=1 Tax=Sulfurifustis variabilis TaxID=1675686 RepID=A0A1B4V3B5_9GAMM|nr:tetratricopeptide repeat protein [Sulfurifustis variabilis]BAU48049.1 putative UDP-N-acetylglucosamine--peptide N-acetylglucosaminyltransferase SPINDLY [Sulfurifustis variabilis]
MKTLESAGSILGAKSRAFALATAGRFAEALPIYLELSAELPDDADVWYLRGAVHERLGQSREAVAAVRKAVDLQPQQADWVNHLGTLLESGKDFAGAEECYRKVLLMNPDHCLGRYNLGNVLNKRAEYNEAITHLRQALQYFPSEPRVHYGLGLARYRLGNRGEAISLLQKAIALDPRYADAHNVLGMALQDAGDSYGAIACYEAALRADPRHVYATNNLGGALMAQGRVQEARNYFRQAMDIKPDWPVPESNLIFSMNYDVADKAAVFEAHRAWGRSHAPGRQAPVFRNIADPDRRLRVGYVSPDFRTHSVMFFVLGWLRNLDRNEFEVYCYSNVAKPDTTTEQLKRAGVVWRDIHNVPDQIADEIIRDDQIDILVDLAGHSADNRLLLFSGRPAPVQMTWLGYPNTTGMSAMDYRVTDSWADPEGLTEDLHTEQLIRMPHGFLCYTPIPDAPVVSSSPFQDRGFISFGSFNSLPKLTKSVVKTWSSILQEVPASRLVLKSTGLNERLTRTRISEQFQAHGIAPDRIVALPAAAKVRDHLGLYADIDIALDTYPYNGTTTTCEALWMGIPVVALAGTSHVARVGVSLLNQVGLTELIAQDEESYVQRAVELAGDAARLSDLRSSLRERIARSPLCDSIAFARTLENVYRDVWRQWCAK